ncbi:MAG: hypothetical protein HZA79_00185 [Sphingobacteriales bacterium]|nr:hypothetical protein [Sphingobacteriales bacterium]
MNQVLPFGRKVLALLFLFCWVSASATDPTISASNVTFPASQIDGGQFQVSFTGGNGTGRIVVVKEGSDITGVPQDFTRYTTNPAFGTAGSEFTAPGEYVVAYTTSVSSAITVTNLKAGTTYYVAIFEFNGNYNVPSTIDYSAVTPTGKLVTTDSAPSTQATITGFSLVAGTSLRVHYTNGNGTGRMVVVKKGTTITALPVDLTQYNYSSVFKSTAAGSYYLDAETFIVLKWNTTSPGTADYAYVSGLEPNSTYTFAVFEYNSSVSAVSPVFLRPGTQMTVTTNAGPTLASSGITSGTPDGNRLNPYWANGNGARRLVIAKKGSAVTSAPVNGNRYTANAQFGMGAEIVAGSNEYVVYDGVSNGLTVTNLEKATGYHFAVYEFDMDANGYAYYLTSSHASATISTAAAPTNNLTLTVSNITGSSAKLNYTFPSSGYGNSRMSVIRDSFPVDFLPVDLTAYSGNTSTYGGGALVAPGTYTLAGQTNGGAPTVTGLTPGHTYYVTIFEMNGTTAPVYLTPGASVSFTIPNEPTAASTNPVFSSIEGNSIRFDWINGNGARRIVVARKGSAVSSVPQDGITYTAAAFGSGTELVAGSGEFVVYDGTFNSVTISNLEKATTYHFAVFEYNPSATGPDYLNAAGKWLAASKATASAPATQTSNLSASNIQLNQATISFTGGSGAGRIFVMREGSPVDAEPLDFVNYNFSAVFGNVQLGTGNFIVAKSVGNFTVTNLKPGTQYYITAFEYNGNSAPVFL